LTFGFRDLAVVIIIDADAVAGPHTEVVVRVRHE
jgi:hypothetical protein